MPATARNSGSVGPPNSLTIDNAHSLTSGTPEFAWPTIRRFHIQSKGDRLRVDTRKWILSKLVPKKYGTKVTAEITGADGGPVQTEEMSSLEIARRVAFLLASAGKENS